MNDLELLRVIEYLQRTRSRPLDTPWSVHISLTCKLLMLRGTRGYDRVEWFSRCRGTAAHDLRIARP